MSPVQLLSLYGTLPFALFIDPYGELSAPVAVVIHLWSVDVSKELQVSRKLTPF